MRPVCKRCLVCGKKYFVEILELWAYKRSTAAGTKYFCSWRCLREYDRNQANIEARKVLTGRAAQIKAMVNQGLTDAEISKQIGVKESTVYRWRYKI